ncbi:MAG: 30S ribosomal protein S4 [Nitrospirae bacterium CG18_big_fil_WC_8_21_14_2_50_70_55]|nr:30S ribosomal protein S4 [Deltaproteobacteria bacterium]OIP67021.1 MAG: 30S ribosomal protein S4 [Nitrospirae bacterium CG2_30_70_394]PIQ07289.1 MAG: 30S ribosomal protein S4 [Nitrospirae bacterium CG18_big_fil_WC_8_21_14_2_50_70_55]PIU80154.1 MAG: 30S ribosomal protein S4 [Nitrospirae bacterium CG06_land_8_20_14_3_00_70_43]PIW82671.1 MAG: 30S ribosomal protein S4 [Nitrospirae bacterium CG_4_8_14_3_um_filter_70_85]PIX84049.1 MAG: 30S ribosomal protein S4 [Nitrospirae bacterium CG_4_10_14_3_
MARYTDSVCRLCRREGEKLFLKGERCFKDKCAMERRAYAPGQHGQGRRMKQSEYSQQLREKQKVRRIYGVLESQFRGFFRKADRMRGVTGENLLSLLERRLDNIVYRLSFAGSRAEARQLVRHGHVRVNGHKVNIPSYVVSQGDQITLREKSKTQPRVVENFAAADRRGVPEWLELAKKEMAGVVRGLPQREHLTLDVQEQLIVELYSR